MNDTPTSVWTRHAAQWSLVGAPLRPCDVDAALMTKLVMPLSSTEATSDCLILGVTPEIVGLPWLHHRRTWAVDHNAEMVRSLWSPDAQPARQGLHQALVARWQELPLIDGSIGLALGDSSFNALPSPQDADQVIAALGRVMAPGAVLAMRCFVLPAEPESHTALPALVECGKITRFDVLKWRLVMSQASADDGSVSLSAVAQRFDDVFPDRPRLATQTGWPLERINTIDAYRRVPSRYHFFTEAQLRARLASRFQVVALEYPAYEMGDRCPTFAAIRQGCPC